MVFSSCSRNDLEASLEKGMGMCLFNLPEVTPSFGGQKCGNGYVEEGEECDCGEPEVRGTLPEALPIARLGQGGSTGGFQGTPRPAQGSFDPRFPSGPKLTLSHPENNTGHF